MNSRSHQLFVFGGHEQASYSQKLIFVLHYALLIAVFVDQVNSQAQRWVLQFEFHLQSHQPRNKNFAHILVYLRVPSHIIFRDETGMRLMKCETHYVFNMVIKGIIDNLSAHRFQVECRALSWVWNFISRALDNVFWFLRWQEWEAWYLNFVLGATGLIVVVVGQILTEGTWCFISGDSSDGLWLILTTQHHRDSKLNVWIIWQLSLKNRYNLKFASI